MHKIAIIADDLTGAMDTGVQFSRRGLKTQVILDWQSLLKQETPLDVIIVDTDSRALEGDAAYSRVCDVAEILIQGDFTRIYKKVDSTLRGCIRHEIDAIMKTFEYEAAFIAPAFPKMGRTTRDGIHYLYGIPINETEFSRDPKTPVKEADISKILTGGSFPPSKVIPLSLIRGDFESFVLHIDELLEQHVKYFIFDAETDEDLQQISVLFPITGNQVLWVGSAGLAEFLPLSHTRKQMVLKNTVSSKPVMLVAGSVSMVTREQVASVNAQAGVAAVALNPLAILASPTPL